MFSPGVFLQNWGVLSSGIFILRQAVWRLNPMRQGAAWPAVSWAASSSLRWSPAPKDSCAAGPVLRSGAEGFGIQFWAKTIWLNLGPLQDAPRCSKVLRQPQPQSQQFRLFLSFSWDCWTPEKWWKMALVEHFFLRWANSSPRNVLWEIFSMNLQA